MYKLNFLDMEIIGIETATYEKTLKEIENFLDTIDKLITASSQKTIGEWLDNQEVCPDPQNFSQNITES